MTPWTVEGRAPNEVAKEDMVVTGPIVPASSLGWEGRDVNHHMMGRDKGE